MRIRLDTTHYCRVIIHCLIVVTAVAAPAFATKKVALVIGNSKYDTSPLKNPANDATDMAALLTSAGFDVILRTDADKRAMLESIEAFGRKLPRAEIGMLYFAGHGMQIKGRNYLIPVNARVASETDVELESVDVYRVLGRMEAAANPVNIIILDACRDNPFERSFRNAEKGLAKIDAPAGSIIVFATAPGGVAADGRGRNGIFTSHLLKTLAKPDISLTRALMETRRNVAAETSRQQIPWESSSLMQDVFLLAGGAPGDQNLQSVPPQSGGQSQSGVPARATDKTRLYVVTDPGGGQVRIMNIVEKYYDGIELDPGRYKLEGSLEGYRTRTQWITIDSGGDVDVTLTLAPEPAAPAVPAPAKTAPAQTAPRTETKPAPAPAASRPSAAQPSSKTCGAYTAPGVWKEFDCYNLAAVGKTTNDDPFTPSWSLIGGYWQWGRKGPDPSVWHNTNTRHFAHGPTGPEAGESNSDKISGWYSYPAPNGAWSDSRKTFKDPCPAGYRVPTKKQWNGVVKNNPQRNVGSWSESATNYSSARFFGDKLMLLAAGYRVSFYSGALNDRGYDGTYWSSSETGGGSASGNAWGLTFLSGNAGGRNYLSRRHGFSVRCVAE